MAGDSVQLAMIRLLFFNISIGVAEILPNYQRLAITPALLQRFDAELQLIVQSECAELLPVSWPWPRARVRQHPEDRSVLEVGLVDPAFGVRLQTPEAFLAFVRRSVQHSPAPGAPHLN